MPRILKATALLAALLFTVACAAPRQTLRLGQISPGLEAFEGSHYDALATAPVVYSVIGEPEYDRFFQEAAAVHGSMLFALRVIDRAETIVAGRAAPTPADLRLIVTVMTDTLPHTQQRAAYLIEEGERLRGEAAWHFAWRFYKIPRARSAVDEARAHLEESQRLAPVLVARLRDIHERIQYQKFFRFSF